MSKAFRRFEILLPLRFNDDTPVPGDLVADTHLELNKLADFRQSAADCRGATILSSAKVCT
jgi:hypothetical protein